MITSEITHKTYEPSQCVYISNPIQTQRYLEYLGSEHLVDILWNSDIRKDALIFVWRRCSETKRAKELWDNHEL